MMPVQRCSNLEIVAADDEWIVLNANTCTVTKLNSIGGYILSLLETPHTVDTIVAALRHSFEGVHVTAYDEISNYIEKLLSIGIIEHAVV